MRRAKKRMSKKKFLILFAAALMVFSLAACESTGEKETGSPPGGSKAGRDDLNYTKPVSGK